VNRSRIEFHVAQRQHFVFENGDRFSLPSANITFFFHVFYVLPLCLAIDDDDETLPKAPPGGCLARGKRWSQYDHRVILVAHGPFRLIYRPGKKRVNSDCIRRACATFGFRRAFTSRRGCTEILPGCGSNPSPQSPSSGGSGALQAILPLSGVAAVGGLRRKMALQRCPEGMFIRYIDFDARCCFSWASFYGNRYLTRCGARTRCIGRL
jgi:hypothetical protein